MGRSGRVLSVCLRAVLAPALFCVLSCGCATETPEEALRRGAQARRQGRYEEAVAALDFCKTRTDNPNHRLIALRNLRDLQKDRENWPEAVSSAEEFVASATGVDQANGMMSLGEILWKSGDRDEAESRLRGYAGETRDSVIRSAVLLTLQNLLRSDKEYQQAVAVCDEILALPEIPNDHRIKAYNKKGEALFYDERAEEAIAVFDALREAFPEDVAIRMKADTMIAQIHHKQGAEGLETCLERIAEACSAGVSASTEPLEIHRYRLLLADAYQKVNYFPQALESFRSVRDETPEGSEFRRIADQRIDAIESAMRQEAFRASGGE